MSLRIFFLNLNVKGLLICVLLLFFGLSQFVEALTFIFPVYLKPPATVVAWNSTPSHWSSHWDVLVNALLLPPVGLWSLNIGSYVSSVSLSCLVPPTVHKCAVHGNAGFLQSGGMLFRDIPSIHSSILVTEISEYLRPPLKTSNLIV